MSVLVSVLGLGLIEMAILLGVALIVVVAIVVFAVLLASGRDDDK